MSQTDRQTERDYITGQLQLMSKQMHNLLTASSIYRGNPTPPQLRWLSLDHKLLSGNMHKKYPTLIQDYNHPARVI